MPITGNELIARLQTMRNTEQIDTMAIDEAIEEIIFLRSHAGAVTRGDSAAVMKRKVGPQPMEIDT